MLRISVPGHRPESRGIGRGGGTDAGTAAGCRQGGTAAKSVDGGQAADTGGRHVRLPVALKIAKRRTPRNFRSA